MFGAIEAGGTKFVCAVGTGPDDLETMQIPTSSPAAVVPEVVAFLRQRARGKLRAVGIASFGPVDLRRDSATYGYITSTPKPEWSHYNLAGAVREALGVPVGFDTDVNGAALGEARWGAGQGISDFVYLTVGTGIGGGAVSGGRLVHGLVHPEMGHIRIPHDRTADPYPGVCPFHQDCLEGLASGPAMEARWGRRGEELGPDHPAWALEARYLALGLANFVCILSPQRIILGGGVMQHPELLVRVRAELLGTLNNYIQSPAILERSAEFVVPPKLGARAGVLGGIVLAGEAAGDRHP